MSLSDALCMEETIAAAGGCKISGQTKCLSDWETFLLPCSAMHWGKEFWDGQSPLFEFHLGHVVVQLTEDRMSMCSESNLQVQLITYIVPGMLFY